MTKNLWFSTGVAVVTLAASVATYLADISYLPSILMFVSALMVMGASMTAEDTLLARYDTPHDDDKHPPQLILLRAARVCVRCALASLIFYMAFGFRTITEADQGHDSCIVSLHRQFLPQPDGRGILSQHAWRRI